MIRTFCAFILLLISGNAYCSANQDTKYLYRVLDQKLDSQSIFRARKQEKINILTKELFRHGLSITDRYYVCSHLYDEYIAFNFDSASVYVNKSIDYARQMGNEDFLATSLVNKSHILAVAGMFDEAESILGEVDTARISHNSLALYYSQMSDLYLYKAEFTLGTEYYMNSLKTLRHYRILPLKYARKGTFEYYNALANHEGDLNHYKKACEILLPYFRTLHSGDRQYSIVASTLAFFYKQLGNEKEREYFLLLCAISDVEGSITENTSLRELASLLMDNRQYDRAYRYLNASIDDAIFYGTRLRNIQASQLIPKVITGYHANQMQKKRIEITFIIVLSLTTVLLIVALLSIMHFRRKEQESAKDVAEANRKLQKVNALLNETNDRLQKTNGRMREMNLIKEQYITRFLKLNSHFIDVTEEKRKEYNRLARDKRMKELYEAIKSQRLEDEETELFYANFDEAFLNIFPDFLEKVNKLLKEGEKIEQRSSTRMKTDLRVLALLRLGITDNKEISSILRSSITTIYTYRSRLKSRAIDHEHFEDQVMSIDKFD